jgi:hypothetical protein
MKSIAFAVVLGGLLAGGIHAQAPPDPTSILAAAHAALGGQSRIAGVKTLVVSGRTRQVRGDNLVPIEFELNLELPDRYVRREEVPAQGTGPTFRGFNGTALISPPGAAPQRGAAGRGAPPPPPRGAPGAGPAAAGRGPAQTDPIAAMRQDVVRLLLGFCASSLDVLPVTYRYAGTAEAPEGTADALDVSGAGGFAARLFISQRDRLPLMVSWATPSPQGPAESRLYFADYREVDGLKLPFRIRRANGVVTTEETTVDRYRVNTKIDPRRFEVKP